jgi:hypothetical protein
MGIFRTSEFWVGLVAAILQFLVAKGVLSQTISDFVNMAVVYILARIMGKTAKALIKEAQ